MKRSVNRALSMILTLAMSLTLLPAVAFAREETPAEGEAPLAETQLAPLADQAPNAALLYAAEAADYAEAVLESAYGDSDDGGAVRNKLEAVKTLLKEGSADEEAANASADTLLAAVAGLTREEEDETVKFDDERLAYTPGIGEDGTGMWYAYPKGEGQPVTWYQLDFVELSDKSPTEQQPVGVSMTFTGSRIEFLANRGPNYHSKGVVLIDEDEEGTPFNTRDGEGGTGSGQVVFTSDRLTEDTHTVRVNFTGTDADSGKGTAYFIGFRVYKSKPILDKTELVRTIAEAAGAEIEERELTSARQVLNNFDATQDQVDRAVKGLTVALNPNDPSVEQAVVRLGSLKRIYVKEGTEAGAIPFPETVTAYLDIGGPVELPLGEFTSGDYNGAVAGVYTFEAPVQAPRTVSVPSNLKAALTVQVGWDGFDDLRARWYEYLIGTEDCWTEEYVASVDARVDAFINRFIPLEACAATDTRKYVFSDYEAVSGSQGDNHARTNQTALSYDRVKSLAIAVKTPGSKYNTQYWADQVVAAMAVLSTSYTRVGTQGHSFSGNPPYGSGYDWAMGTPQRYIDLLTIMWDELAADTGTYLVRTETNGLEDTEATLLEKYMGDLAWHNSAPLSNEKGANRTWLACARMTLGALEKNEDKIKEAIAGMRPEFNPATSGEGFYADGSFLQHGGGAFAYTGGYGKGLLVTLSGAMWMFHGSEYPIEYEDHAEEFFYDMIFEAYEPLIVNGLFMDMSREREITRPTNPDDLVGAQIIRSIAHMSQVMPKAWSDRAKSLVKEYLLIPEVKAAVYADPLFPSAEESKPWFNEYIMPGSVVGICENILKDDAVQSRGALDVTKIYTNMARIAHQKPGWGFSASMHSDKVQTYEVVNSEGSNRWHVGDGMTYVYTSDTEQYNSDYYAALDMQRLAGTTVERVNNLNNEAVSTGNSGKNNAYAWAGGSSLDGQYGVGGMMLKGGDGTGGRTADSVDARKSWFMFDDEVVAVGSGITSNTGKTVETVIDNRKLLKNMGENVLTIDGETAEDGVHNGASWMHLTGNTGEKGSDIGWYFPTKENVSTLKESRTGTWNRLNQYFKFKDEAKNTNRTNNYATLWIDHGAKPTGADYAYVILPGKSAAETDAYVQHADIEVLAQTPEVHAVRENTLGITGYNFWTAGTCGGVTVSAPASVMVRELDETLELDEALQISVADPTRKLSTITVTLDQPTNGIAVDDPAYTVTSTDTQTVLEVNVKGAAGKSFEITLVKGAPEADATAPDSPANLTVTGLLDTELILSWTAPTDKDRLTYHVYQGETKLAETGELTATVEGLIPDTAYSFHVLAVDPSGNQSLPSNTVEVTTLKAEDVPKPEVLFQENFDEMNLGEVKDQGGWSLGKTGQGQTDVIANPKGDGQSLVVSAAKASNERDADYTFPTSLTGKFNVSCKVYIESGKACTDTGIHLIDDKGNTAVSMMMWPGSFGYKYGGSKDKQDMKISAETDRWYTVDMYINVGDHTFDIMIDGDTATVKTDLAFRNTSGSGIKTLRIGTPGSAAGQIIIDDVLVTRPSDQPMPQVVGSVTATPAAGVYRTAQSVSLDTATDGAAIYYTIDGSTPTKASTRYEGAIQVAASTAIKAFAVKDGMVDSPISTFVYTIDPDWGMKTITSVPALGPITAAYGTVMGALPLPTYARVTLDDASTRKLGLRWSCPDYNANAAGDYTFTGALDLTGQDDLFPTDKTLSLTVQVKPREGGGDSGPSGTGSGAPAVNATKPVTAGGTTTVTVEKKAAVTDGSAEAAFTDSDLKKAADSAVKAAEEAGTTPELKLQLKTSGAVNAASASLPTATLKDMLEAHEDFSLTVSSAVGSVTLDGTALSGVLAGADGKTVTLTVCTVEQPELTAGQLPLAGDRPVVDVQITGGALAGGSAAVVLPYALAEDETADDLVIWHVDDAGKLEAIPCTYADGFVRFVTTHFSRFVIGSFPFDDVAPGTWYYGDAVYAYQTGLLAGTGDRTFSPETVTTRGMLVTMLWRQAGSPKEAEAPFQDVPTDAWYAQAVAWAARNRIVNGYDENRFGPDDPITREQMAVILRNYARTRGADTTGGSLEGFTDSAAVSNWAAEAVGWAVERGLMNGVGGDTLAPGGSADRAQTAAMLRRLLSMA